LKKALVFPGQGSQEVGMGKSIAERYSQAQDVFQEVDEALSEKLSDLIWHGDLETLTHTKNVQPAIMATSIAILRALESEGLNLSNMSYFAGHSLGEYTALCAAGTISLSETARLLRARGESMQDAIKIGEGSMAAILGLTIDEVEEIVAQSAETQVCQIANDNDPKQVVVSGHATAVSRACQCASERGARKAVMLQVSAPFHCSLMQPAGEVMKHKLEPVELKPPQCPIIANVNARPICEVAAIKESLVQQCTERVRWRETIEYMASDEVTKCLEIGPKNVLNGLFRRTTKKITCISVANSTQLLNAIDFISD